MGSRRQGGDCNRASGSQLVQPASRASGCPDRRQLLTGFLLTLPFQQRFDRLDDTMRAVATVSCSVAATLALVAPVAMHRMLFRQHRLRVLVSAAHRLAYAALVLLGVALVGVTAVVFDVVYGRTAAMIAGGVGLVALRSCGWFSRCAFGRWVVTRMIRIR